MKQHLAILTTCALVGSFADLLAAEPATQPVPARPAVSGSERSKPNIVLILADDLGYGDVGCYGAKPEHVKTPNIDRLAREGIRFTDGHCASSVCTPSRYSLLTGEYAFRNPSAWGILPGDAKLGFRQGTLTLPEMVRSKGYVTGFVGKWHLGLGNGQINWNGEIKPGPMEIGFDSAFYMPSTGDRVPTVFIRDHRVEKLDPADPISVDYKKKIGEEPTGRENPEKADVLLGTTLHGGTITEGVSRIGWMAGGKVARWKDEELMDRLTDESIAFIRNHQAKPFFLYFAPHGIHEPRVPAKRFVGQSGAGVYGDQIVELDASLGRILQTLEELQLSKDTLVVFTSDNGGSPQLTRPKGDMGGYQYGARADLHGHVPNGVLRGGKYNAYEGGTRVPFIVRWTGHVPVGQTSPALVSQTDLEASFARLLGLTLPDGAAPDSRDVLDALLGKSNDGRQELVEHRVEDALALRDGRWKFINGELYDLSNDLSETKNVAGEHPDRVAAMAARIEDFKSGKVSK